MKMIVICSPKNTPNMLLTGMHTREELPQRAQTVPPCLVKVTGARV